MKLHNLIVNVAKQTSTTNPENLIRLERQADEETSKYLPEDKGLKGMYAKIHKGWIFPLLLIVLEPLLVAWLSNFRNKIMFSNPNRYEEEDIEEDVNDFTDKYRM